MQQAEALVVPITITILFCYKFNFFSTQWISFTGQRTPPFTITLEHFAYLTSGNLARKSAAEN